MLDKLLDPILAPFRMLRSKIFQIKQIPQTIKGDVSRAKAQVSAVGSDFKGYGQDAKAMQQKGVSVVGNQAGGQAAAAPATAPAPQAARPKKMGLFGGKKKCPGCGQKLHASWEECPYCGWGKAAAPGGAPSPSPGGKQRTVSMDLNAAGGMGGGIANGVVGWFIPLEGKQMGELFQLKGRVSVGSSSDNDVVMVDCPSISGHHCEFVASPSGFKLNDLGSTNGTFVNDKRVTTHELIDNDNVKLGKVNFKFKSMV
ncbi:MAG: FHA domain-containing protein [Myxococcales bacterium]|nr:FHA domain-containing protein [Myxococcales bacterium]